MSNTDTHHSEQQPTPQHAETTSFETTPNTSMGNWADQVAKEQEKQQQPDNAFDWDRSLQQQISALVPKTEAQAQELGQHREILTRLQALMEENAKLKSENSLLRKELEQLRNGTQHPQQQKQQQQNLEMEIDNNDEDTQDAIGKACDKVALAMSKIAKAGSGAKDSMHATTSTTTPQPRTATPKISYASAAKKNVGRAQKRRSNNVSNPTEGMVSWATRMFASESDNSDGDNNNRQKGYTIVYLDSTHRSQHSETRKALAILGVPQGRIIDVHFPIRGIIGLLIHKSFERELKDILQKAKLKINEEFKPQSAASLKGAQYDHLEDNTARTEKAEELFTDRMLRTCARMPKAYLGAAIIRHFVYDAEKDDPHRMLPSAMTRFNAMRPQKEKPTPSPVPSLAEARKILGLPEVVEDDNNDVNMRQ